jgi:hypothetical protein
MRSSVDLATDAVQIQRCEDHVPAKAAPAKKAAPARKAAPAAARESRCREKCRRSVCGQGSGEEPQSSVARKVASTDDDQDGAEDEADAETETVVVANDANDDAKDNDAKDRSTEDSG